MNSWIKLQMHSEIWFSPFFSRGWDFFILIYVRWIWDRLTFVPQFIQWINENMSPQPMGSTTRLSSPLRDCLGFCRGFSVVSGMSQLSIRHNTVGAWEARARREELWELTCPSPVMQALWNISTCKMWMITHNLKDCCTK